MTTGARRWSKEEISLEILALYADGEAIHHAAMQAGHPSLLRAAQRRFGSWRLAVEFAGLDYDALRKTTAWTRDLVIARIRELHAEGADLSYANVSTRLDPALAAAAVRTAHFGSWGAAIEAAGLQYARVRRRRRWDDSQVVQGIRDVAAAGQGLSSGEAQRGAPALFAAASRRFGSWDEALRASGLDPDEVRRR